jgi:serine/threonine-protein kinase HipA
MPEVEVTVQIAGLDVLAGRMYTNARRGVESTTFSYDPAYIGRKGAYALDPALPLFSGATTTPADKPLFNAFSDSAPDRWGQNLMRRSEKLRADAEGTTARTLLPSDFLLGSSDVLRQGALRYREPGSAEFLTADETGVPRLVSLPDLITAADSLDRDTATPSDIRDLLHAGGSLGGARPKAAVVDSHGRLCIAKFPKYQESGDWSVIGWEKTALDIAHDAGINAAKGDLVAIGRRSALVLPRFDRDGEKRIGYMSALTALESSDGDNSLSYLDIVEWIEENSAAAEADAKELWRRMAFSIAIGNTDDHLRNHGFLRTGGGWRLAPAFDINPTPDTGPKSLATAIAFGDNRAELRPALEVSEYFGLDETEARTILVEISSALSGWRRIAQRNGLVSRDIDAMADALDQGTESTQQVGLSTGSRVSRSPSAGPRRHRPPGNARGGQFMAKGQSAPEVELGRAVQADEE